MTSLPIPHIRLSMAMATQAALLAFSSVIGVAQQPDREFQGDQAHSLAYILQAEKLGKKRADALTALAESGRDVIIIDASFYGDGESWWTAEEIASLRADNPQRVILCYLSIGEAEDYRGYWEKAWKSTPPEWMLEENPEWEGNFKVRFWHSGWQEVILQQLDQILTAGFDGVYLDIVDAFEHFEHEAKTDEWIDDRANPETGNTYREDMIAWVQEVADHARDSDPAYLVVPQNASQLLKDERYTDTIDAIGVEDLFTNGKQWKKTAEIDYRCDVLDRFHQKTDKPIFLIDYCHKDDALHARTTGEAAKHGFNLLITKRNLGELGICPK